MIENIIKIIGESYETSKNVYNIIGSILGFLVAYKAVFFAIGFLFTRKFLPYLKRNFLDIYCRICYNNKN